MKITRGSWHYRLARLAELSDADDMPTNICPYMRAVVFGFFKFVLLAIAGSFVIALFGTFFLGVIASLIAAPVAVADFFFHFIPSSWYVAAPGSQSADTWFSCAVGLGGLLYIAGGVFGLLKLISEAKGRAAGCPPPEPGLLRTYMQGVHDKTCIGLEYIDKETP